MSQQLLRPVKMEDRPLWMERWLARKTVSPSDLITFEYCPRDFYFRKSKVVGIGVNDTPRLLGINIHRMIAKYFGRISDKPSPASIRSVAQTVYEQEFDEKRLASMKKRAERCWANFVRFEVRRLKSWKRYMPTIVEGRLKGGGYSVIVDFYSEADRKGLDWKSGRLVGIDTPELIQGKSNTVVLESLGNRCDNFSFVGLLSGREMPLPRVNKGWLDEKKARIRSQVKLGNFPARPSGRCKSCQFILNCQMWKVCLWS